MSNRLVKALGASLVALALTGCPPPSTVVPPQPDAQDAAPRAAVKAFLGAEQRGDFAKAYALLAAPLRARYTPERLQSDYQREQSLADDKLARVRAALEGNTPIAVHDGRGELPLGEGLAVHIVDEGGSWRIQSLE